MISAAGDGQVCKADFSDGARHEIVFFGDAHGIVRVGCERDLSSAQLEIAAEYVGVRKERAARRLAAGIDL